MRWTIAPLLLAAAAFPAFAHDVPSTLDLEDLIHFVEDRIEVTAEGDPKVHAAYVRIGKALLRENKLGLADDLKKLDAVAKERAKALAAEAGLGALLDAAVLEARGIFDGLTEDAEDDIDLVEEKRRKALEKAAIKARADFLAGKGIAANTRGRLAKWKRAALGFRVVGNRADVAVEKQGGPVATTFTATAGKIYTVAGTGSGGFNGDGRAARRSNLYWVEEIKFGPDGLLYILDWNNHMLRRREANGTLTRIVGAGIPGDSEGDPMLTQLNHPSALDFDAQGRIYMAAWHNHKVKVYDPTGESPTVYTIAGTIQGNLGDGGSAAQARYNLLPGVLLLPPAHPFGGGDLLTTDAANQCVRIVKIGTAPMTDTNVAGVTVTTGPVSRFWGTGVQGHGGDNGQASAATLGFSKAQNAESDGRMAIDAAGNVFIVSGVEHVIRKIATDGVITTVAGNGTAGFSGDGGPATAAQLNFPSDVAVAADGTLYISDQNNHCVRKVAPGGTITTFAGIPGAKGYDGEGGDPTAAHLNRPTGLELDADGNLWICDKDNSVVRVVASNTGSLSVPRAPYVLPVAALGKPPKKGPTGSIDTFAGTGIAAFTGDDRPARETDFYWPQDIAVNPATGLLYIVDWNNHRIRRVEDDGNVKTVLGVGQLGDTNGPALEVRMNHPTDITFGPIDGDLYVATWHTDKIKRLSAGTNTLSAVNKVDGRRFYSGDGMNVNVAELNLPSSVKFDATGNMYIADAGNRRVRKVNASDSIINTIAGNGTSGFSGDDDQAVNAQFNLPVGQSAQPAGKVCLDPAGTYLYVADTDNHRVRRVHLASGIITTFAGNGTPGFAGDGAPATAASLNSPVDVDCDSAGNVYIADRDNHCVRKVTLSTGFISTVAGTGGSSGYEGDGGAATAAKFYLPCGVFVDRSTGRLFVADTFNSVVRVVWE